MRAAGCEWKYTKKTYTTSDLIKNRTPHLPIAWSLCLLRNCLCDESIVRWNWWKRMRKIKMYWGEPNESKTTNQCEPCDNSDLDRNGSIDSYECVDMIMISYLESTESEKWYIVKKTSWIHKCCKLTLTQQQKPLNSTWYINRPNLDIPGKYFSGFSQIFRMPIYSACWIDQIPACRILPSVFLSIVPVSIRWPYVTNYRD